MLGVIFKSKAVIVKWVTFLVMKNLKNSRVFASSLMLFLALMVLFNCSISAVQKIDIHDLGFEVFSTARPDYDIEQISSPDFAGNFSAHDRAYFNFGLTSDIHWIRFSLPEAYSQPAIQPGLVLAFDYAVENLKVYLPLENSDRFVVLYGGYGRVVDSDELPGLTPAFLMPAGYDWGSSGFIRIETSASSGFAIEVMDRNSFESIMQGRIIFLGLLAGLLVAMILYNFFLFLALRHIQYVIYVLFALSALVYQATIVGVARVINFSLYSFAFEYGQLLSFTGMFFWLLFAYHFLNINNNLPVFKPVFQLMMSLAVAGFIVNFLIGFQEANVLAYLLGISMPVVTILAVFVARNKGYWVTPFYMAGIITLMLAVLIFALRGLNLIPHSVNITYAIFVAVSIEAMLYSFALADQVRSLSIQNYTLQQQRSELSRISMIDELTGLYNKRDYNKTYENELSRAREEERPLSLVLLDIDKFKGINDSYGHLNGDEVLRRLGLVLKEQVREKGHACRVGGEEFAIILPNILLEEAVELAEKLRQAFAEEVFIFHKEIKVKVTVSLGVGQLQPDESGDALYDRVDRALYRAKYEGRNKVAVSS